MLVILQIILALFVFIYSNFFIESLNRVFIFKMIAINLFLFNVRSMLLFILQGTNRIKEFAQITMIDKILYIVLIISFLFFDVREFKLLVIADLMGKFISMIYAMYCCKDIIFQKINLFYFNIREAVRNINVGIKLMFANIASMLIIGVVRFGIERTWDVATFGKVSLVLSISNLMMIFINAIGIIMFPILRRTDDRKLANIYLTVKDFLMIILLGLLIAYFPLKVVLSAWLPKYAESLVYMAILFPMFVYEGKTVLLINTYLKTLRKEKLMLKINLISLSISILLTFITTMVYRNLDLAILSIVFLLAIRSVIAELYLSKILSISVSKDVILELLITIIFILLGWLVDAWYTVLIYTVMYILYLLLKKKDIAKSINNVRILVKA
ncbi:membrane protein [Mesobacillus boroniphilus JCM 21738]|uniref:Membrane protein n=2 Tax=Mesobacillus boroniphilus TaxID=308892 RepID=W4RRM1_9BACI|nr:membrane protein [Mesobacillus boroniphilus JCM 21738]